MGKRRMNATRNVPNENISTDRLLSTYLPKTLCVVFARKARIM
jgi:hypothetical protein